MAEENSSITETENGMKITSVVIIILVAIIGGLFFMWQQEKNKSSSTASEAVSTGSTKQSEAQEVKDAGAIGKNEVKLTKDNFKTEVEDSKGVILVEFYLSTCPHCQNVAKEVTAASDQLVGKAKVGKIDARANSELSEKYNIDGVPTFIVFKNGKEAERASGERTKDKLIELVEKNLK